MQDLTLSSVKEGLDNLKNLGHVEDTFEIRGHTITIRTLKRHEEEEANEASARFLDGPESPLPWMNAQKYETLSRSIVRIDDIDLHGVEEFPDGDETIPRHKLIRDMLNSWNIDLVDAVWEKYEDLVEESKERIFDEVEYMDKEELLSKHRNRVDELRDEMDRPPLEEASGKEDSEPSAEDLDREDIREALFDPDKADDLEPEFGEVVENKRAEAEAARAGTGESQVSEPPAPETADEVYDADTGEPLTEEERKYVKAQEEEFQRRQGEAERERQSQSRQQPQQQPQQPQQQNPQNRSRREPQKSDERQPMNRANPEIKRGGEPRGDEPAHIDDGEPPEEDIVESGTQHLGPTD